MCQNKKEKSRNIIPTYTALCFAGMKNKEKYLQVSGKSAIFAESFQNDARIDI